MDLTLTSAIIAGNNNKAKVSGIENVNVNWDAYGTADIDAENITGATITASSVKAGFLGNMTVTNTAANDVVAGSGMTGTLTVSQVTDSTVTGTNATKIIVNGKTAVKDTVVVTAGTNTTTTTVGSAIALLNATVTDGAKSTNLTVNAENATVNADNATTVVVKAAGAASTTASTATINTAKATSITVDGTNESTDSATIKVGVDATLKSGAAFAVETVNLDIADGKKVTVDAASTGLKNVTVSSEGTATIAMGDADDLDKVTVTNNATTALNVNLDASTIGATLDLSKVAASVFNITGTAAASQIKLATTSTLNLDKNANLIATTVFSGTTATTDVLNMTVANDLTAVTLASGAEAIEQLNLAVTLDSADAAKVATLTGITADKVKITSSDKVNVVAFVGTELDASNVSNNFTVAQAVGTKSTILGGSGVNTFTVSGLDVSGDNVAIIGGNNQDTVTITGGLAAGTEASLVLADGKNTLNATTVTDASLSYTGGAGVDTLTVTLVDSAATTADASDAILVATLGAGNDVVNLDTSSTKVELATISAGEGNDTLKISTSVVGADVIIYDAGAGTDTLDITGVSVASADLRLTDVEIIKGAGGTIDASDLTAQSYQILGTGAVTGTAFNQVLNVTTATAGTYDFSSLTFGSSLTDGINGLDVDAAAGAVTTTFVGSSANDSFTASSILGAKMIVTAGAGNDSIVGHDNSIDTIIFESSATANGTDDITVFKTGQDKINLDALTSETALTGNLTTGTTAITIAQGNVFLVTGAANSADSAANSANAINAAAKWTESAAGVKAYFVIADDNSSAIYEYTYSDSATEIQDTELTLMGTVDKALTAAEIVFA